MIVERIARETGVSPIAIEAIINSANRLYKTYPIRKRTEGLREISQPTPTLKFLQRWVVRNFIAHLPVHPSVTSYQRGKGIYGNAQMHAAQRYLLKIDFRDFFPSVTGEDVRKLIVGNNGVAPFTELDDADIALITKIACRNGRLTIGAPSSPSISNAVLFEFDEYISIESAKRQVLYSRYADDISFSTNAPNVLSEVHRLVVRRLLDQTSPRLTINGDKTVFTSKKRRRLVTGLVLTSKNKVSIGRDKKREIKTLCYLFATKRTLARSNIVPERLSVVREICRADVHS